MTPIVIPGVDAEIRTPHCGVRAAKLRSPPTVANAAAAVKVIATRSAEIHARGYFTPVTTEDQLLDDDAGYSLGRGGTALSPAAASAIQDAARWGKYYLYFIFAYLALSLVLQLIGFGSFATAADPGAHDVDAVTSRLPAAGLGIAALLVTYVFILAFYAYPGIRFWGFVQKTPEGLEHGRQAQFVDGIDNLRSVFKYFGILFFCIAGLYALIILGAIAFGLASGL